MDKLIDALLEYNGGDWGGTADDIDEIYRELRLAPSLIFTYWKEKCEGNDKCCFCGGDLAYRTEKEYRGEHFGFDTYEEVTYGICTECGEVF